MTVNKAILATHSTYFRNLWFLEFGDKHKNPVDFSHLPVDCAHFCSFIESFYGKPFPLNESNVYELFYLAHYFLVDKMIEQVATHLKTHSINWAWLNPFIAEASKRNDLRALQFIAPFLPTVSDLSTDDIMNLSTAGFKTMAKYCTSKQSLSWFIGSIVESIHNQDFDLNEFSIILNSCPIGALSSQHWDEFLFVPLQEVEELEDDLKTFWCSRVKQLTKDELHKQKRVIDELKTNLTEIQTIYQSKTNRFSQTRKHWDLEVSQHNQRVAVATGSGGCIVKNILGEDPLIPGMIYNWKLRYQGYISGLVVGVIDESRFDTGGHCSANAHCFYNNGSVCGCLSGDHQQWKPNELLQVNVNLIDYTITIKTMGISTIRLSGYLPRLRSGHYYYSYARLCFPNHVLEMVE
ncbi:hypothetical protein GEMRC1_000491 [Eukaryota sp. GEM-RC1]